MITKGSRHIALYKKASFLKNDGATPKQIESTIRYMNSTVITPPVSEGSIRNLMKTVMNWFEKEAANVD